MEERRGEGGEERETEELGRRGERNEGVREEG